MDLVDLRDRLQTSYYVARLYDSERKFLVELIESYVQKMDRKEIANQKAMAVAQHIIWLEEFHGFKTEAAIADAEQRFNLKRTRITDILRKERPKWDSIRTHARSEAGRQVHALMKERLAEMAKQIEKEGPPVRRSCASHALWLEQLAEELPMLVNEQKEVDRLTKSGELESAE
jgi:hypothetical protein